LRIVTAKIALLLATALALSSTAAAESFDLARRVALTPLVTGLDQPVQLVTAGDHTGAFFIPEQSGKILALANRNEPPRLFLDISSLISCCDNGGLLSLVFDPHYVSNGRFFVLYVNRNGDTVVARYSRSTASPGIADPSTAEILLLIPQPKDNVPNHHGGTLKFGPDGYLYISIGDGGAFIQVTNRAQVLQHLLGKLLRIDVRAERSYAVPPDNPFAGISGTRGEIWSYGLRNPWRFSFDRLTGDLLMGDVGHDSWEEIDILSIPEARGANFGWPRLEGQHCFPPGSTCNVTGLTLPQLEYPRELGCSVTGGYRYRGTRWPALYGTYLYGDYCSGRIWAATQVDGQWSSRVVADTDLLIVSFGEDDEGELYVVDHAGAVFELAVPAMKRRAVRH
jgi:glucose/arabinose dehydrogenase